MKLKSAIYTVLLTGVLMTLLLNCKKEDIKTAPTITITEVTNITSSSANSGGDITSDGGSAVTSSGVCWSSTNPLPTLSDSKTNDGTSAETFVSTITGLLPGTTYTLRAYAVNAVGSAYSSDVTFTTVALAPVLTTTELSALTASTAISGGIITNDGGSPVTARGVCWSMNQTPTIADIKTASGSGSGSFAGSITGLLPGTTYFFRAFATNTIGTAYGNQITTTTTAILSVLTTTTISAITATTVTSGGNITNNGGSAVTARGVCWSTSANPTTASSKTSDATGSGVFTSSIAGLTPGVTYYIRSYATNSIGTSYGNEVNTTTSATLPTITTNSPSSITSITVTSGGNITNDGGSMVTARGVCWSTSANPTTASSKTSDATGSGIFASSIIGLTSGKTYYVRAYATNSIGTSYGNEVTAITAATLPTITTTTVSAITATTAASGGTITNDGGAAVTAKGVCWSTTSNPTIANSKSTNGNGTSTFASSIVGLSAGLTYYVRAYAINSIGTTYGNNIIFNAVINHGGTVTDVEGNTYPTVTIGTQVWMAENLKTTKLNNGTSIPLVTDNTEWTFHTSAAYCWYNNDEATFKNNYGALYKIINQANLCPIGWHVPDASEWIKLTDYLGGIYVAGAKLKEAGISHWLSPNSSSTNERGFTALPGGFRSGIDGKFQFITRGGWWWTSTEGLNSFFRTRVIDGGNDHVADIAFDRGAGLSIRCLKD